MNVIKEREKSSLLRGMEALHNRVELLPKDDSYYSSLKSGYEGEKIFDRKIMGAINNEAVYISDLLLNINGKSAQIDAILITASCLYVFEVKNYYGEYKFSGVEFANLNGYVIVSPLDQLNRSLTILTQLLKQWNVQIPVDGKVVCINPSFTLFTEDPPENIILPTQLDTFLKKMNSQSKPMTSSSRILGKRLLTMNQQEVPFQKQLPPYEYVQLRKGVKCPQCNNFNVVLTQRSCRCLTCKKQIGIQLAILYAIDEYKLLYPRKKMTTRDLFYWMGGEVSKYKISNTLETHYKKVGRSKDRHYE